MIAILAITGCSKDNNDKKYYPLVGQGKIWSYGDLEFDQSTGEYSLIGSMYLKIGEDTIIDGKKWNKVYTSYDEFHENWVISRIIMEEKRKVYVHKNDGEKSLLYDFSAEAGDDFNVFDGGHMTVDSTRSLPLLNREIRKHFFLTRNTSPWPITWIEGIGSLYGFFGTPYGEAIILLCYEEDGDLIYQDTIFNYNTCYFEDTTNSKW